MCWMTSTEKTKSKVRAPSPGSAGSSCTISSQFGGIPLAGVLEHGRRDVDADDVVEALGRRERETSCAAAELERRAAADVDAELGGEVEDHPDAVPPALVEGVGVPASVRAGGVGEHRVEGVTVSERVPLRPQCPDLFLSVLGHRGIFACGISGGGRRFRQGMSRLLGVSGSLQVHSSNRALLELARRVPGAGAVLYPSVGALPHFDPDLEGENVPAVVAEWRALVGAATGVLIASPEYAHGIPGSLKNALDWLVGSGELYGKPVAVLSASTSPRGPPTCVRCSRRRCGHRARAWSCRRRSSFRRAATSPPSRWAHPSSRPCGRQWRPCSTRCEYGSLRCRSP